MEPVHNLDINSYSLDDLLNLFELDYNLSTDDMLRAKRKVLMMHPDKSKLPSTYFLFYKKAYEILLDIHRSKNKMTQNAPTVYTPEITHNNLGSNNSGKTEIDKTQIQKIMEKNKGDFNKVFNEEFDKNIAKKVNTEHYAWFSQETPDEFAGKKISKGNMAEAIESVKKKQQALAVYQGVKPMKFSGGQSVYDDDDEEYNKDGNYIECDVFSKFKFEDIRKVHRDQTVISVSERDYDSMPKYANVEQYAKTRGSNVEVGSKADGDALLAKMYEDERKNIMRKQQRDLLLQRANEEKQQNFLSSFLRLGNI
jgi:hypothetical protein